MSVRCIEFIKSKLNKRIFISTLVVIVFLVIGVVSHNVSAKAEYPYLFHYYISNNIVGVNDTLSYNFSSMKIIQWILSTNNGNVIEFVKACQVLFSVVLSLLFMVMSYLAYRLFKEKSIYSYPLIIGALLLVVFTSSNQLYHIDSIVLPLSFISASLSTLFFVDALKKENLVFTGVVSAFVLAFSFVFGNLYMAIVLLFVIASIVVKSIRNKKITVNEIAVIITSAVSIIIYLVVYFILGKQITSLDIPQSGISIVSTFIRNFALAITGPSYDGNRFSPTIMLLVGAFLIAINALLLVLITIKQKKYTNNIAYYLIVLVVGLVMAILNKDSYLLAEKPYFVLSLAMLMVTLLNIETFFNDFALYQKLKEETKFLASNVFYAVLLVIPLFNYGYAQRDRQFMNSTMWAFIKEDMRCDENGYTAVGLNVFDSETFCTYLWKNKLGDYADLKISNKVQESSFIYGSNNIVMPFDIDEHYWFPQVVHAFLDSKEGNTFSFKIRVEDDQVGTYCRIFIDQKMVCNDDITENMFTFTYDGLNKNEIYGVRIEIGRIHSEPDLPDFPQLGFQLYEMEIK